MFKNSLSQMKRMILNEINNHYNQLGLEKGKYSVSGINIDLIEKEMEIVGFNKVKGEDFVIFYDWRKQKGRIQHMDGTIKRFVFSA